MKLSITQTIQIVCLYVTRPVYTRQGFQLAKDKKI